MTTSVDTSSEGGQLPPSFNPIIQKARWIAAKLKAKGARALLPEESVFIAELSRRAWVHGDRTAQGLVKDLQAAHLNYQLTLSTKP
jgi:hypothetical protein